MPFLEVKHRGVIHWDRRSSANDICPICGTKGNVANLGDRRFCLACDTVFPRPAGKPAATHFEPEDE